jgi:lipopolysaccharide/colanic/teichoic acid biosynthesis glycosyltransferase
VNHAAYLTSRRKRALDLLAGGAALLLASPFLAAAVVAIRLETHGHPVYRQRRVGREGRPFELYKLRTMVSGA